MTKEEIKKMENEAKAVKNNINNILLKIALTIITILVIVDAASICIISITILTVIVLTVVEVISYWAIYETIKEFTK